MAFMIIMIVVVGVVDIVSVVAIVTTTIIIQIDIYNISIVVILITFPMIITTCS